MFHIHFTISIFYMILALNIIVYGVFFNNRFLNLCSIAASIFGLIASVSSVFVYKTILPVSLLTIAECLMIHISYNMNRHLIKRFIQF